MSVATTLLCPPLIDNAVVTHPENAPDVWLMDVRFNFTAFHDRSFQQLTIPEPLFLQRSVARRRAEYLVSRYALRTMMSHLGVQNFILSNDENRAPVWPQGIVASLSHTHQRVCALLSQQPSRLLGIDCEKIMDNEAAQEMAEMIASPQEQAILRAAPYSFTQGLTALFSAKESLYKAVWPRLQQFMNFDEAELTAWQEDKMTLCLKKGYAGQFSAGMAFQVEVRFGPDEVLTWIVGSVSAI